MTVAFILSLYIAISTRRQPDIHHAETTPVWERLLPSITEQINSFRIVEDIKVWHSNLVANVICYPKKERRPKSFTIFPSKWPPTS